MLLIFNIFSTHSISLSLFFSFTLSLLRAFLFSFSLSLFSIHPLLFCFYIFFRFFFFSFFDSLSTILFSTERTNYIIYRNLCAHEVTKILALDYSLYFLLFFFLLRKKPLKFPVIVCAFVGHYRRYLMSAVESNTSKHRFHRSDMIEPCNTTSLNAVYR